MLKMPRKIRTNYRIQNEEVLYSIDEVTWFSELDIVDLKKRASANARNRVRVCVHRSPQQLVHEMLIVHGASCYIRPHKHPKYCESMTVLEGYASVFLFDDYGNVTKRVEMGPPGSGDNFYQNMPSNVYHSMVIKSEYLVFFEVTQGPFTPQSSVFPPWAPEDKSENLNSDLLKLSK